MLRFTVEGNRSGDQLYKMQVSRPASICENVGIKDRNPNKDRNYNGMR